MSEETSLLRYFTYRSSGVGTVKDIQIYFASKGLPNVAIVESPFTVSIKINHYWFRLAKIQCEINRHKPITVVFNISKMTFMEWLRMVQEKVMNSLRKQLRVTVQ